MTAHHAPASTAARTAARTAPEGAGRRRVRAAIAALWAGLALALAAPAALANPAAPFAPAILVNDGAITGFELSQREAFLRALNRTGDVAALARDEMIDDRLRLQAAERMGLVPPEAEIEAGMAEFAGRANLDTPTFLAGLADAGVAPETFRDFVTAGLAWREVVRARFGPRTRISETEIDQALALLAGPSEARVLISEIILPADTPERASASEALAREIGETVSNEEGFAAAARAHSASSSRLRGGRLDWVGLGALPPPVASAVLTLGPGEVSAPVRLAGAIALFQLRALEETGSILPPDRALDLARLVLPGADAEEARRILARIDTCNDLYGLAGDLPAGALTRETVAPGALAPDIARGLATLDPNETLVTGEGQGGTRIVMLCARNPLPEAPPDPAAGTPQAPRTAAAEGAQPPALPDRGTIRRQLSNARLEAYANSYLAELRAEAIIRTP